MQLSDITRNYELPLVYFISIGWSWESRVKWRDLILGPCSFSGRSQVAEQREDQRQAGGDIRKDRFERKHQGGKRWRVWQKLFTTLTIGCENERTNKTDGSKTKWLWALSIYSYRRENRQKRVWKWDLITLGLSCWRDAKFVFKLRPKSLSCCFFLLKLNMVFRFCFLVSGLSWALWLQTKIPRGWHRSIFKTNLWVFPKLHRERIKKYRDGEKGKENNRYFVIRDL